MAHEHLEPVIIEDLIHIGEDLGYNKGHEQGMAKGQRKVLAQILAARGVALTVGQQQRLDACDDPATLTQWAERALRGDDPADWLK